MTEFIHNLSSLKNYSTVSLYGAGSLGAYSLKNIQKDQPHLIVKSFIDDRKNGSFHNIQVESFESYKNHPSDILLICSSYWRDIVKKIEKSGVKYSVLDLLAGESDKKITAKKFSGREVRFATPNNFLKEVVNNFENIEPATNAWIDGFKENSVFFDVGASCGIYALYASVVKSCTTVAFEPDTLNHSIMEQNFFLNKELVSGKVTALNMGLGEAPGLLPLICQDYMAGAHGKIFQSDSRESQATMEAEYIQNTLCDTIDHIIKRYSIPVPRYLKIDVDGFEMNVLKGAKETLADQILEEILVETDLNHIAEIENFLKSSKFSLSMRSDINEITGFPVSGVHNYLFKRS